MSNLKFKLSAKKRDLFGRKVKRLRNEGLIPANIFGKKVKSEAITVNSKEFREVFEKSGETQIIDLDGRPVLVSNLQVDPVTSDYVHIDFRQVDLSEKITANVPVEVVGESPAEKQSIGTVVQQLNEIEVEALPADLPEKIEVDSSVLVEVDQTIYVKDLKIGNKVTIKTDLESIVVKVEPPVKEEVVEVAPTPVEGDQPVEGAASPEGDQSKEDTKAPEDNSDQSA